MVDNYRDLELVVNNGIRVAFQATSPDEEIDIILEYMGKALNADRVYIVEKDEKDFDNNTYEWCADGVEPEKTVFRILCRIYAEAGMICLAKIRTL